MGLPSEQCADAQLVSSQEQQPMLMKINDPTAWPQKETRVTKQKCRCLSSQTSSVATAATFDLEKEPRELWSSEKPNVNVV